MPNLDLARFRPLFIDFLGKVKISSKEFVEPRPITPYLAQEMFLDELCEGLDRDIHHFCCLKARQLGISTILLALDIFWLYMFPGLQGALIADTSDNKETFRATITEMLESLPPQWKVPIKQHNRNHLLLANGSRLQYMSAGKNKNSGLGRSRALNYVHATEASGWGDQKGLESLLAALAQENPNRLYIFESTALGYNLFYDMYKEAKEDGIAQKAFFIGWWAKDIYRLAEGSAQFTKYWGSPDFPAALTDEEAEKCGIVERDYGVIVEPEQIAWYRWTGTRLNDGSLQEEYPWHEAEAWQATGSSFFNLKMVNTDIRLIYDTRLSFNGYRYQLGELFTSMKVLPVTSAQDADLRVWEEPKDNARYVIGSDPAYGRSETADRSVISVWRCYSDKLVQVAEYCTPMPDTRQVAWVLAHLAGCYRDCMINLEISGPGGAVMQEMKYLKQQIQFGRLQEPATSLNITNALDTARWFLWRRPDSMGSGFAYSWKTSWESKLLMFNRMRDAYNTEQIIVRSIPLLEEMNTLVQDGDSISASGRNHDDRAFAAGLAHYAWAEWVRSSMMSENRTFDREQKAQLDREAGATKPVMDGFVAQFFKDQADKRQKMKLEHLTEGY